MTQRQLVSIWHYSYRMEKVQQPHPRLLTQQWSLSQGLLNVVMMINGLIWLASWSFSFQHYVKLPSLSVVMVHVCDCTVVGFTICTAWGSDLLTASVVGETCRYFMYVHIVAFLGLKWFSTLLIIRVSPMMLWYSLALWYRCHFQSQYTLWL